MAKHWILLNAEVYEGFETGVKMKGGVQEYAMNFLAIFNNVKSRHGLLNVWSDYTNGVYVSWRETEGIDKEAIEDWLSNYGEVMETRRILVYGINDEAVDYPDPDLYWASLVVTE